MGDVVHAEALLDPAVQHRDVRRSAPAPRRSDARPPSLERGAHQLGIAGEPISVAAALD
jgi:hypothetical protein